MSGSEAGISPDLVARACAGDDSALRRLIEAAYPTVRRWALVQTSDPAEADDVSQDVMLKMLRKLHTFAGQARFDTWLYTMTRNAALDRIRSRRKRTRALEDPRAWESLVPKASPDPAHVAEGAELRDVLRALFTELPDRQREVFDLVELQGLTAAEAAALMGVEPVSVRAHLFKARRRLRGLILQRAPAIAEEVT